MILQKKRGRGFLFYLAILTSLFFVQIWPEWGGLTFRLEDVLIVLFVLTITAGSVLKRKLFYRPHRLNLPILMLMVVVGIAIGNTLFFSPYGADVKQDAFVNGLRLLLAMSLFFIVYNYPVAAGRKINTIQKTIVGVSFATTAVALLQIAHWLGWLPVALPSFLTELKEGANQARGREIFALYIGNTGTHTWSGMLALQAIVVWFVGLRSRSYISKFLWLCYFLILSAILIRLSVRNSILGLFVAILVISFLMLKQSRFVFNRFAKPVMLFAGAAIGAAILFIFGGEYYFIQRILQTLPQIENGALVISRASNIFGRIDYMFAALLIFQMHPILGGGFYSFQHLSDALVGLQAVHAHNAYVQTLAEMGVIGIFFLLWMMITLFFFFRETRFFLTRHRKIILIWQITAAYYLFLGFTALFSNNLWSPTHLGIGMILLGLLASQASELNHQ